MQTKITTKFGQLLARPELLVMSGGFSPLHARMSEVLGYEAFFMSGSQVAAYVYGYPDVGLLGLSEMVESVRRITNVGAMPIFSDADTGYGNAVNVYQATFSDNCRRRGGLSHYWPTVYPRGDIAFSDSQ